MKRRIIALVLILLIGVLAGGWWWARTWPERATQLLVDVGLGVSQAQQLIARLGGQTKPGQQATLVASGSVEGEEVAIVSEFGGQITKLPVEEGDEVEAGQVLVELDTSLLMAQKAQAEAAVAAAQANLERVKAGTHPAEILAAKAALLQAVAEQDAAKSAWEDAQALLKNPQEINAQIAQAKASVGLAAAKIEQAEAQLAAAQAERDKYRARGSMQEKELYRAYNYQVEAAQAAVDAAKADKAGAEKTLKALQALRANPLALVGQVHLAQGQYGVAEAGVAVAEARLTELEAGPTPEEIIVAEAKIAQAQAAVASVQAQIEKMTLRSPMTGLVTSRSAHEGEAAVAGATLLTVANLDEVKLTIYIPEDQLGRAYLGQEVQVQVDSFPGRVFTGTISYISQEAEFTPKNVQTEKERVNMVFAVKVHLPNPEHLLKPGMPADAILKMG